MFAESGPPHIVYLLRLFPGQGRIPSSSASPNSCSSHSWRSRTGGGTSSSSNQSRVIVWSHRPRCRASSSKIPPRSQSVNHKSASTSSGPLAIEPNLNRSDIVPLGKAILGGTQALTTRRAVEREVYRTFPLSASTKAQGVEESVAKRDPVAIVDASKRSAKQSIASRQTATLSMSGLKRLCGNKSSEAKTSQNISFEDFRA